MDSLKNPYRNIFNIIHELITNNVSLINILWVINWCLMSSCLEICFIYWSFWPSLSCIFILLTFIKKLDIDIRNQSFKWMKYFWKSIQFEEIWNSTFSQRHLHFHSTFDTSFSGDDCTLKKDVLCSNCVIWWNWFFATLHESFGCPQFTWIFTVLKKKCQETAKNVALLKTFL